MKYVTACYWDKGPFRAKNQDSFSLQQVRTKKGRLLFAVVCDGVGGLYEGERASGFVAEGLTEWFYEKGIQIVLRNWNGFLSGPVWTFKRIKRSLFREMYLLHEKMKQWKETDGLSRGTTATMVFMVKRHFLIVHVGDSRAYKLGKKEKCLTRDEKNEKGQLLRCIGTGEFTKLQSLQGLLWPGQELLLCTDGFCNRTPEGFFTDCLRGMSEEAKLQKRLQEIGSFLQSCKEKDNQTAICIKGR